MAAAIAAHSVDPVVAIDAEQQIIYFNDSAEELFGYKRAEILGSSLNRLIPERFRADHPGHVRSFAASPVVEHRLGHQRPVPGLRKDGTEFIAEIAFSKIVVDDDLILVATLHDVTLRIEIDEFRDFLVESSRVLTASFEFGERADRLAHLIVPRYADWCLIDLIRGDTLTRAAVAHRDPERESGLRRLRVIPTDRDPSVGPLQVLIRGEPEMVQVVTEEWLEKLELDSDQLEELRRFEPESMMILPLITEGRTLGVVTAAFSGSDRVYTSDAIRIGLEFAGLAALHVNNSRLYREAIEASQIRDKVLRIVAHDLRNPLHTIALSTGLLRELNAFEPGSPGANAIATIERTVTRADRLIQDLLEAGRAKHGGLEIDPRPVRPEPILEEALDQHAPLADEKEITLQKDWSEGLPLVMADRNRLLQVLENLIGNAIKFTPEGGRVTVGAKPSGEEVVFWVEDTGPGIEPAELPKLFDPFWQAARSRRGGAGLGLAISQGIIEAHHGRIRVESEVGRGSRFVFGLPVAGG